MRLDDNGKNASRPPTDPRARPVYADRVAAKRMNLNALKGQGKPLGGAPPVPKGKLAPLLEPQPDIPYEVPPDMRQQPPLSGVGAAYEVNQALSSGETEGPVTMGDAKRVGRGGMLQPQQEGQADQEEAEPAPVVEPAKNKIDVAERDMIQNFQANLPFDFQEINESLKKLMGADRRKRIEARLAPMDLTDMITKKELQQEIPIVPGKLRIVLRTWSQQEYLWMLEYLWKFPGSANFTNELLNTFKMVCALVSINGARIPDHRNDKKADEAKFKVKMDIVAGYPTALVADISLQVIWFNERVLSLYSEDELKNG